MSAFFHENDETSMDTEVFYATARIGGNKKGRPSMKSFIERSQDKRRQGGLLLMLPTLMLACGLTATPCLFAASTEEPSHDGHATPVAMPERA